MDEINYLLILLFAVAAIASPGPATLAIVSTSMSLGRRQGLSLACGVLTGSIFWSTSAAFGLATVLATNLWLFELLRYAGAAYLLYLACKSLKSALTKSQLVLEAAHIKSVKHNYIKGLLIHLTNPKAIFFFVSLYSLGVPSNASPVELASVILAVAALSSVVFLGYAVLFSNALASRIYLKSKVVFESVFAVFFSVASIKMLMANLEK